MRLRLSDLNSGESVRHATTHMQGELIGFTTGRERRDSDKAAIARAEIRHSSPPFGVLVEALRIRG